MWIPVHLRNLEAVTRALVCRGATVPAERQPRQGGGGKKARRPRTLPQKKRVGGSWLGQRIGGGGGGRAEVRWMGKTFRPYNPDQCLLLPAVRQWLPEDHWALFLMAAMRELDLSETLEEYERGDGREQPPDRPVTLLLYAYCTGTRSSRDRASDVRGGGLPGDHGGRALGSPQDCGVSAAGFASVREGRLPHGCCGSRGSKPRVKGTAGKGGHAHTVAAAGGAARSGGEWRFVAQRGLARAAPVGCAHGVG